MSSDLHLESAHFLEKYLHAVCRIIFFSAAAFITLSATFSSASANHDSASPDAALWRAIALDYSAGVVAALRAGAHVDAKRAPGDLCNLYSIVEGSTPIHAAIPMGNERVFDALLATGADIRSELKWP